MSIKLVQGKVIDVAEDVDGLNFSHLHGSEPWQVYSVWGNCEECLARVVWETSERYQVIIRCSNGSRRTYPAQFIDHQGDIIPSVKYWLKRLFQDDALAPQILHNRQQTIVVQPVSTG
jgi:hypothetical protein